MAHTFPPDVFATAEAAARIALRDFNRIKGLKHHSLGRKIVGRSVVGLEAAAALLQSNEKAAMLALTVHDRLEQLGHHNLARVAKVIFLETSGSAQRVGAALGLEINAEREWSA